MTQKLAELADSVNQKLMQLDTKMSQLMQQSEAKMASQIQHQNDRLLEEMKALRAEMRAVPNHKLHTVEQLTRVFTMAARVGDVDRMLHTLQLDVDLKMDVNRVDEATGNTPLHVLCSRDSGDTEQFEKQLYLLHELMLRGCQLQKLDTQGNTPFMVAARFNELLLKEMLVYAPKGVIDWNIKCPATGNTLAHLTAEYDPQPTVEQLIIRVPDGLDPTLRNHEKQQPWELCKATLCGRMLGCAVHFHAQHVAHGPHNNQCDCDPRKCFRAAFLFEAAGKNDVAGALKLLCSPHYPRLDVNYRSPSDTLLLFLSRIPNEQQNRWLPFLAELLNRGGDPCLLQLETHVTAMQECARAGNMTILVHFINHVPTSSPCWSNQCRRGNTLLHDLVLSSKACNDDKIALLKLMVSRLQPLSPSALDPFLANCDGKTALELAKEAKATELIRRLESLESLYVIYASEWFEQARQVLHAGNSPVLPKEFVRIVAQYFAAE